MHTRLLQNYLYVSVFVCVCSDMMPALHNYATVDSDAFLAKPQHMEMIFDMCKSVSTTAGLFKYMTFTNLISFSFN